MKKEDIESLFFCKIYDFLYVYIPKQKNGTENTLITYRQGLKTFRSYVNAVVGIASNRFRFKDCTYDFLLDYRNYLHDAYNLKEKTVNNKLAVIKAYMAYVAARDINLQQYAFAIGQVPYYSVPRTQQPIIEDVDALAALLGMPSNTKKGLRDKVIMSVLYDGAIRVDELVSLKNRDLCLDNENIRLRVRGKGNKERNVMLDSKTSALIRQYLEEYHSGLESDVPFIYTVIGGIQKHMSTRNVQKLIKKYSDKARADYEFPVSVSPHTLRRTRGTTLYRDGVDLAAISVLLGHSDMKTTRDHYTSPSLDQMREIANRKNEGIPEEEPIWPNDEDEMTKILGL
jgi:site-specific recombinase XerD